MTKIASLISFLAMSFITGVLFLGSIAPEYFSQDPLHSEFQDWKQTFNKTYDPQEHHSRFAIFKQNYKLIESHNQENHSYGLAANQYMDLTFEEFSLLHSSQVP